MGSDGSMNDGLKIGHVKFNGTSKTDVARMLGATLIGHHLIIDIEGWLAAMVRRLRRRRLKPTGTQIIVGSLYSTSGGQLELELDSRYHKQVDRAKRAFGELTWQQQ